MYKQIVYNAYSYSIKHNTDIALKKSLIEKKLEESGEKARLEEYLRQKLIECGWKDELKEHCMGKNLHMYFKTFHFHIQKHNHSIILNSMI